jgi:RHS repeat-associated protein
MAGISDKALKTQYSENKYRFSGQLYDNDLDWDTYQMKYRTMDPQVGRFWQIDPLAPKYVYNSTFAYAENRPTIGIDLEGTELVPMILGFLSGNQQVAAAGAIGMYFEAQEAMQANYRLASGESGQADSHLPTQIQSVTSTANQLNDAAAVAQPAVDVLDATTTFASMTPLGEAGLPEVMSVAGKFAPIAFDAESHIAEGFTLNATSKTSISPKVQTALEMLNDMKADGATLKVNPMASNQELNMTIEHNYSKLDLRVETHDLPTKLGGLGSGAPVRHMNVDLTPGKRSLPNCRACNFRKTMSETSRFFVDIVNSMPIESEWLIQAPHKEFVEAINGIPYESDGVFLKLILREEYRKKLASVSINDIHEFIQQAKILWKGSLIFESYDGFEIGTVSKHFVIKGTPLEYHLGQDILFISSNW